MATRGRGTPRECPAEHAGRPCGARVAPGRLLCRDHWRRVPAGLRTAVLRAWGRWNETHLDTDWHAYLAARSDALTAAGKGTRP